MKKLLIILATLMALTALTASYAQERQQKEAVRSQQQNTQPRQFVPQERQQKEVVREQANRSSQRPIITNPPGRGPWIGGNVYHPSWNRWNRWGAPLYGYNFWTPGFYYDPWGYRNPTRIYHYGDNRRDTVRGKATRLSFGVQLSTGGHGGAFLTLGNRGYFIAEYNQIFQRDEALFYPDLTMDKVLPWNDQKLEDIQKGNIVYLGFGKKISRTGLHAALGFGRSEKRYQFFDELYILSNNGKYSIRAFEENFFTVKVGAIHDFGRGTLKVDYDPIRKLAFLGAGVNF